MLGRNCLHTVSILIIAITIKILKKRTIPFSPPVSPSRSPSNPPRDLLKGKKWRCPLFRPKKWLEKCINRDKKISQQKSVIHRLLLKGLHVWQCRWLRQPPLPKTTTSYSSPLFLLFLITYISSCGLGKCTTAHGREGGGAQDNFQLIITQLMMILMMIMIKNTACF